MEGSLPRNTPAIPSSICRLGFSGASIAWYDRSFRWDYAILALIGLLLAHTSANVLNDYFDYRSGIDLATKRTPFSGGIQILEETMLQPKEVFWFGMIAFLLTVPIGVFFVIVRGWILLPLLLGGAFCLLLYTPLITRIGWPE